MNASKTLRLCMAGITAGMLVGCNGTPTGRVPVSGSVMFDGKPLEHGNVIFIEPTSGASVGVGHIVMGKYSLRETAGNAGIRPGNYGVRIESWIETPDQVLPDGSHSKGIPVIPRKYMNHKTSGFSAEVSDRGAAVDFTLTSEGSK